MRRACSRDYYCLREAVIAEKMKLSLISCHHLLFGNSHENQHQKTVKSKLLRRPEPSERRDAPALPKPLGRVEPSTCAWQHGEPSTRAGGGSGASGGGASLHSFLWYLLQQK